MKFTTSTKSGGSKHAKGSIIHFNGVALIAEGYFDDHGRLAKEAPLTHEERVSLDLQRKTINHDSLHLAYGLKEKSL